MSPVIAPCVEEVVPIGNDVLEGVRRDVPKVHGLKVKALRDELLIQLGQMGGIPEDAGVSQNHQATGPVQLPLEIFVSSRRWHSSCTDKGTTLSKRSVGVSKPTLYNYVRQAGPPKILHNRPPLPQRGVRGEAGRTEQFRDTRDHLLSVEHFLQVPGLDLIIGRPIYCGIGPNSRGGQPCQSSPSSRWNLSRLVRFRR